MDCDRRTYLGLLAGVPLTAAGCLGDDESTGDGPGVGTSGGSDGPVRSTVETTPTPTGGGSPAVGDAETAGQSAGTARGTAGPGEFVLTATDPAEFDSLTIYPPELAETLRTAAATGDTVRAVQNAHTYVPRPVLPAYDAVELVDPSGAAGGRYHLAADGGVYYHRLLDVEAVSPPADATATPVADLPAARRDLVERVVRGDRVTVSPETERGEWVREAFFGEYFTHEGTTYRGYERQQTDAAFFSTEVWYVLSLDPAGGAEGGADGADWTATPTPGSTGGTIGTDEAAAAAGTGGETLRLVLADVPESVRTVVDRLLADRSADQREVAASYQELPPDLAALANETAGLLTHVAAFSVDARR